MKIVRKTRIEDKRNYWDITIPKNHNFVLEDGSVVHNCGVGVGFSTQYCHINKLPTISKRTKSKKIYVIPDSVEGWADAVGVLMSSYFTKDQPFPEYAGHEIEFDFSLIRPKGSLISWGGIAPGPDGLNNSLQKIAKVIERRLSKENTTEVQLPPIDAYDIIMHISDAVLSGGIRRCLPEYYSIKMADGSYKKINEIEVGDEISFLGNSYPVTNIFDNGIQELVKINTQAGWHVSTPNHRWFVIDQLVPPREANIYRWVEAKDLTEFHILVQDIEEWDEQHNVKKQVISVEDYGKGHVYDIEVKDVHLFTARNDESGFESVSHNSATINLFSPNDLEMATAKTGDWFLTNPQRGRSNNSALLVRNKTSREDFHKLFESTKKFGEPGFVWADHENITFNPCAEIGMWPIEYKEDGTEVSGWQFCNLSEINGKKANTKEAYIEAAKYASIIGTLQAGYSDFPYMGSATENITRREALLGVSITGMMDNPDVIFDQQNQKEAAEEVLKWNEIVAKMIGINSSARTTCVKPSGCLTKDAKIKTESGDMTIEDIFNHNGYSISNIDLARENEWLETTNTLMIINEDGVFEPISKLYINGVRPVYDIEFEDGSVFSFTGEHKLKLSSGEWKRVDQLTEEDNIAEISAT